ncbi:hypothetical protein OAI07_00125 [Akkermansiaceae bacterium]|nr:hypothetical protein [Akkermansiaceae bacterium]
MIQTIINALLLIILGIGGFINWEQMNTTGQATNMFMPVFFGGCFLICLAFSKQHFRHGLYGGLIFALLGIISAIIRIYQFGHFKNLTDPKMQVICIMLVICIVQTMNIWKQVQKDRAQAIGL